jgi:hypothetical protein
MKAVLLIIFIGCAIYSSAQKTVDVSSGDVNAMSLSFFNVIGGEPFVNVKFTRLVDGSPYFSENWMKGNIMLSGEREYPGVYLKLDLFDNEVHYRDTKGNELTAVTPIWKVVLFDTAAQKIFTFINGSGIQTSSRANGWYEILVEGKASLFNKIEKRLDEKRPYGSATIEQSIISTPHYFILHNGTLTEVKKIKDIPDILAEKKAAVAEFTKEKNLSGRGQEDLASVIAYFNSLN